MKLRTRADEPKTTLALLDRFKAELVVIEPPRSVEVLGGKFGHGMGCTQWSGHEHRLLVAGLDEDVDRGRRQESSRLALLERSFPLNDPATGRAGSSVSVRCREALTGSAHQVKGRERRGPRHQEATMPKYLLHDEYTPHALAGGGS